MSCGRVITWRKKWARNWAEVRYCSDACRRRGRTGADSALEEAVRSALTGGRSVTDVELTRAVGAVDPEPVRRAARRLVAAGEVELVQRGRVVDPSTAKGAFTIRRTTAPGARSPRRD